MSTTAIAPARQVNVGIGQLAASADPGLVLSALGLGSCIGLVMVDPGARVAGMVHVMLPESHVGRTGPPGKFADTAVPALLEAVEALGAGRSRLVVSLAGGAQMFGAGLGDGVLNIGERNLAAVAAALRCARLTVRASDVGGSSGRTLQVTVGTGRVTVRAVGRDPIEL